MVLVSAPSLAVCRLRCTLADSGTSWDNGWARAEGVSALDLAGKSRPHHSYHWLR